MKNICLIIDTLFGGGTQRVINLATELVQLGHYVYIIILYQQIDYIIKDKRINIHNLDFSQKKTNADLLKKIKASSILSKLFNIAKMMKNPIKIEDKYTKKFAKEMAVNKYLSL